MKELLETIAPVEGKTYSLFGREASTSVYYRKVGELADQCLVRCPDIHQLIRQIDHASRKKRLLKNQKKDDGNGSLIHFIVTKAGDMLAPHTASVTSHLRNLSLLKRWDGALFTSEEQYHLFMLEIELVNRAYGNDFMFARRKIAFLPYCLRDLTVNCRSNPGELDVVCRGCSRECFINRTSTLLRAYNIEPYLWMNTDLKSLFRDLRKKDESLGVLGVACVPELMRGLRLCMRQNIPVVGIPLNANRCIRWMGEFRPTSVDLEALEKLLQGIKSEH